MAAAPPRRDLAGRQVKASGAGQALELGWRRHGIVDLAPVDYFELVGRKTGAFEAHFTRDFEALDPKYPADKASHCGHAVEKPPKCQGIIP